MVSLEDQLRLLQLVETQREKERILWEILDKVIETLEHTVHLLEEHLEEHNG